MTAVGLRLPVGNMREHLYTVLFNGEEHNQGDQRRASGGG